MSSAARPVEIIPDHRESDSGLGRKPFAFLVGITVHVQPGILFVFTPECFSRSPRNRVRLRPESPPEFISLISPHKNASWWDMQVVT